MNTTGISSFCCTYVVACAKFPLKLTKATAKNLIWALKGRWNWSSYKKMPLSTNRPHGLTANLVIASKLNSVVLGSNPTHANFLKLLLRIFQRPWMVNAIYKYIDIHIHDNQICNIMLYLYFIVYLIFQRSTINTNYFFILTYCLLREVHSQRK